MPHVYEGHWPGNVSRDAKYALRMKDGEYKVHLNFRMSTGVEYLLSSDTHQNLVAMVNGVKREVSGPEGGAFYINEYYHVLVPGTDGKTYFAGEYNTFIEFDFSGGKIGPVPPHGIKAGDPWPGPHVGIPYTLAAGGDDFYWESRGVDSHGQSYTQKSRLSDALGKDRAKELANRIAAVKGSQGGRVYLNEASEFFSPPANPGEDFIYLGHLDPYDWFPTPPTP